MGFDVDVDQTRRVTRLQLVPVTFALAAAFVDEHHRRLRPPPGHKFSIGAAVADDLVGVVIVGRPVARLLDTGRVLEVTRLATDGTANVCSLLLGAAWRAARALGYQRLITYTRADEDGASLRAAGWSLSAVRPPRGSWSCPARPRAGSDVESVARVLWDAPGVRVPGLLDETN
ncbi:XF1762 family protein [Nonomuraea sp. NPDC050394]|uniref:XF1762 family protein n=1 Tax=Nonomuraea sp. NPDC050394 TaxID=3364363 RepID=UPI0037884C64